MAVEACTPRDVLIYLITGFIISALGLAFYTRNDDTEEVQRFSIGIGVIGLLMSAVWPFTLCGVAFYVLVRMIRAAIGKDGEHGRGA